MSTPTDGALGVFSTGKDILVLQEMALRLRTLTGCAVCVWGGVLWMRTPWGDRWYDRVEAQALIGILTSTPHLYNEYFHDDPQQDKRPRTCEAGTGLIKGCALGG